MGQRQKDWARRARAELTQRLGGKCAHCSKRAKLEFDCIIPQGDKHHKKDTATRMCFYRVQHFIYKNVQLLCDKCHAKKTHRDNQKHKRRAFELMMLGNGNGGVPF